MVPERREVPESTRLVFPAQLVFQAPLGFQAQREKENWRELPVLALIRGSARWREIHRTKAKTVRLDVKGFSETQGFNKKPGESVNAKQHLVEPKRRKKTGLSAG